MRWVRTVWEFGIRFGESARLYVFRIGGMRATELRMLSGGDKMTGSCAPEKMGHSLALGTELSW